MKKDNSDRITIIRERLSQAKLDGNKNMIKIWEAILNKLLSKK